MQLSFFSGLGSLLLLLVMLLYVGKLRGISGRGRLCKLVESSWYYFECLKEESEFMKAVVIS